MNWIEIPAARMMQVTEQELCEQFELIRDDGVDLTTRYGLCDSWSRVAFLRRISDKRLFKPARFVPALSFELHVRYLEEV